MDKVGRIVLPKPVRERLGLAGAAAFRAEVVADRLELTPLQAPEERGNLVERDGMLVYESRSAYRSAGEATVADREDRERALVERHQA
jgi:bifunctional DNA-binding transcriptional regulator/antitoxin component of YhaV-PrlF toxin-antitoxin module